MTATGHDDVRAAALEASEAAQERAGVTVRELTGPVQLDVARVLFDRVWPTIGGGTQVTANMLRAISHSGGYVVAAFDERDRPVGAALAFIGRHRADDGGWAVHLHSHMAAVLPVFRDRHVGTALKLHQRWWALDLGIPVVAWTFDPLVRRNARLNLVKLGAEVRAYLPDFYGEMDDEVNAGGPTDRLLAWWAVGSDRASDAAAGRLTVLDAAELRAAGAVDAVAVDDGGAPRATGGRAATVLVALPDDVVALRIAHPDRALAWRHEVRDALQPLLDGGGRVVGVTDEGAYVVEVPA